MGLAAFKKEMKRREDQDREAFRKYRAEMIKKVAAKRQKVIIEIYGGVASVTQTVKGVTVLIRDHDDKREYENIDGINSVGRDIK